MDARVLDVAELNVRFGGRGKVSQAVNGISFTVDEGEILGIVGESGSGKTATMLAVLKLLHQPPAQISAKHILFDGKDLAPFSEGEMRRVRGSKVAMVFQDPTTSLNPVLRIGYQIMEPLIVHKGLSKRSARLKAAELLQMVGIADPEKRLNDYPHRFSGGMRQRVMIAIALACNPSLLIADEPTTALDVTIQAQILELVKGLRNQLKMSMIWISHDLGVVAGLVDRLNIMYAGYIVESGAVDEVYDNPLHPYTEALLRAAPSLGSNPNAKLIPIHGNPPDVGHLPPGCPFAPRCSYVKSQCIAENPRLVERAPGHSVACWAEISGGRRG
jgi:oligopeptide transport system ATP-binding protein